MAERKSKKIKADKNPVKTVKRRKRRSVTKLKFAKMYSQYQIVGYISVAAVVIFFVTFRAINISIERQLKIQMPEKPESPQLSKPMVEPAPAISKEPQKKEMAPEMSSSAPQDYNIRVMERSLLFQNERGWSSMTRRATRQSDVLKRMSQGDVFKGVKKTPEQYRRQLLKIKQRIREYELRVQNDPSDDYARQKLQGLYMLKATIKSLKKAIVEK